MRVAALRIKNFRGIREGVVYFGRHTVLIGPGNVGKTTIIEALALLFGRDRLVRDLTEHDFTGSCPAPQDRVELVATLTDFPGSQDPTDHHEWFRDGRGVPKYFDQATGNVHATQGNATWTLACQVGVQARFDQDALEVETVRYFHDRDGAVDPFDADVVTPFPPRLVGEIGFYLVRANRSWDGVLSFGSELFRRTVSAAKGQPAAAILAERDRLRKPEDPIERDPKLQPLVDSINKELARLVPRSPSLALRVSSTDSRGVLGAVIPHFQTESDAVAIPASRQGSGLVSLQALLLLLELGRGRTQAAQGFLMGVEEPELHVPAPSQGRLVRRIQALSSQSIVTTHAVAAAAVTDPTSVLVLRNDNGRLLAPSLLEKALTDEAPNYLRKYFYANRQAFLAALLHDAVLVPEGRSEHGLLNGIAHALDVRQAWDEYAPPSFALSVGVIPTEDSKVLETYPLVARVHGRVSCLVDGDDEGRKRYVKGLRAMDNPPSAIISWPEGWDLERVVGWLAEADAAIWPKLAELKGGPKSAQDLARVLGDSKANTIVYEVLAAAIAETPACAKRAAELLSAIASVCAGRETPRFKHDAALGALVLDL
jgi:putative ATP-dependent endonuclease of OLD family